MSSSRVSHDDRDHYPLFGITGGFAVGPVADARSSQEHTVDIGRHAFDGATNLDVAVGIVEIGDGAATWGF